MLTIEAMSTHIKDRSAWDISDWLNQGNNITTLSTGFTNFPDGRLPAVKVKHDPAELERRIQKTNKELQARKQAQQLDAETRKRLKEEEKKKAEQQKIESRNAQIKEQMEVLTNFCGKATYRDVKKLCELAGLNRNTIGNARLGYNRMHPEKWTMVKEIIATFKFSKKKEPSRRAQVMRLSREAAKRGEKAFMAPCEKHGMAAYRIYNGSARCLECKLKTNKKSLDPKLDQVQKDRRDRKEYNVNLMNKAIEQGEKNFTGLCLHCGYTSFKYHWVEKRNKHEYRCIKCQEMAQEKHSAKRKGNKQ